MASLWQTIFEINSSSRNPSSQMMRAKRLKDQKAITSFQHGRQERLEGLAEPIDQKMLLPREEYDEEDMVESVKVRAAGPGSGSWGRNI